MPILSVDELRQISEATTLISRGNAMPSFGKIKSNEIFEKGKEKELVTVVDKKIHQHLSFELKKIVPGCVVLSEESPSKNSYRWYQKISHEKNVFILDPLDGTANYIKGDENFTTALAHMSCGEITASWTYSPVKNEIFQSYGKGHVEEGISGVNFANNKRDISAPISDVPRIDINRSLSDVFTESEFKVLPNACRTIAYVKLIKEQLDALCFYGDIRPWDHAGGIFLLSSFGGVSEQISGKPYNVSTTEKGILAASKPEILNRIRLTIPDNMRACQPPRLN